MPRQHEEENECIAFAQYLTLRNLRFSHIPNETPAGKMIGGSWMPNYASLARNKAMGVHKGVPDFIIIVPNKNNMEKRENELLFIEMKKCSGGKVSDEQRDWISELQSVKGVFAGVANGFEEAKRIVDGFLK